MTAHTLVNGEWYTIYERIKPAFSWDIHELKWVPNLNALETGSVLRYIRTTEVQTEPMLIFVTGKHEQRLAFHTDNATKFKTRNK